MHVPTPQPTNHRLPHASFRSLLIALLCAMAAVNLVAFWNVWPLIVSGHSDFVSYYAAGKMLGSGQGGQLFDEAAQFETQSQFSAFVRARQQPFPYIHPPFEALLFEPLSYLSYLAAFKVWLAINLLLLGVIGYSLRHEIRVLQWVPWASWVILPFAIFPFIFLFAQGQDDVLVLCLLVLCFLAIRRQSLFKAGIWLGLASFRPQFALPLLLIFTVSGAWRVTAGFFLSGVGLLLISAGVFGWRELARYPNHLFYSEQISNPHGVLLRAMPNLHGLLSGLFPNGMATATLVVSSVVVVSLAVWWWRRCWRSDLELAFSLAIVATLLVSYHSFPHDLTLLVLPLLLQANWILRQRLKRLSPTLSLLPTIILLTPPVCYLLVRFNCFNVVAVGLLIWFTADIMARPTAPHSMLP